MKMSDVFDFDGGVGYPATWTDEQVRRGNRAIKMHDELIEAIERQRQGLWNLIDYDLIRESHIDGAMIEITAIDALLKKARGEA